MTERLKLWSLTALMFTAFVAAIGAGFWAIEHGHKRVVGYVLLVLILIPIFGLSKVLAEGIVESR